MDKRTYDYYVQVKDHSEIPNHTLKFLESHATVDLCKISVEDINEFLHHAWQQALWAGTGYSRDIQPPVVTA